MGTLLPLWGFAYAPMEADTTVSAIPMMRVAENQASTRPVDGVLLQGVVTDTDNFPLPGAHVMVRRTSLQARRHGLFLVILLCHVLSKTSSARTMLRNSKPTAAGAAAR